MGGDMTTPVGFVDSPPGELASSIAHGMHVLHLYQQQLLNRLLCLDCAHTRHG
jgi:hypothetical protein